MGVFPIKQALEMAEEQGLDLVEISPDATPPVCKVYRLQQVCIRRISFFTYTVILDKPARFSVFR